MRPGEPFLSDIPPEFRSPDGKLRVILRPSAIDTWSRNGGSIWQRRSMMESRCGRDMPRDLCASGRRYIIHGLSRSGRLTGLHFVLCHFGQLGSCDTASLTTLAREFAGDIATEAARARELAVASHAAGMTRVTSYAVAPPSALCGGIRGCVGLSVGDGPVPLVGGCHFRTALASKRTRIRFET
jgi:hypothetical protein